MFVIHIIMLFIFILTLACVFHKSFVEMLPVGISSLVLLLYVLSFGRHLGWIDGIAPLLLCGVVLYFFTRKREQRKELLRQCIEILKDPSTIAGIILLLLVVVGVSGKVVSWWDDYNFWATDVKSIFYRNGFADKYANAAPEFGDYPPGTQMMKWWFLHFSPGQFREGLLFAGYYVFNLSFLLPLLHYIRKKTPLSMTLGAILLWIFPTMTEVFWCDGGCADFSMAVVYGAFLVAVIDRKDVSPWLYYGRQALYLMVLVLCKNTGFVWYVFAVLFSIGVQILNRRMGEDLWQKRTAMLGTMTVITLPFLSGGGWFVFCYLHRRVAKLTGAAVQMATGGMNIPETREQMLQAFSEAFLKWPLHRSSTWLFDFSPLVLLLFLLAVYILLIVRKKLDWGMGRFLLIYTVITAMLFYTLVLISHLTVFAVETQYLEPYGMVSSISRYGAPFTIGGLYLLAYYVMQSFPDNRGFYLCALVVLLSSDYASAYRAIWGYRTGVQEELTKREEILDDAAYEFAEKVGAGTDSEITRVLYVRDSSDVSWVRNTYLNFEAAPVSVMYANVDLSEVSREELLRLMEEAHATHLYIEGMLYTAETLYAAETLYMGEALP